MGDLSRNRFQCVWGEAGSEGKVRKEKSVVSLFYAAHLLVEDSFEGDRQSILNHWCYRVIFFARLITQKDDRGVLSKHLFTCHFLHATIGNLQRRCVLTTQAGGATVNAWAENGCYGTSAAIQDCSTLTWTVFITAPVVSHLYFHSHFYNLNGINIISRWIHYIHYIASQKWGFSVFLCCSN